MVELMDKEILVYPRLESLIGVKWGIKKEVIMDLKINIDYVEKKADIEFACSEAETEAMARVSMRAMDLQESLGPEVLKWLTPMFDRAFNILEKKVERQRHKR